MYITLAIDNFYHYSRYLRHPVLIRIGDEDTGKNKRIEQRVYFIAEAQKRSKLMDELHRMSAVDKVNYITNDGTIDELLV